MKKKTLYIIWAVLYALCAALGFIFEPGNGMKALMVMLSAAFFVTPAWLLWKGDGQDALVIRNLSIASLFLTVVMLIVNLLSVQSAQVVGDVMYAILVITTVPMVCSQYWLVPMFCWACLMICAIKKLKK